MKQKLLILFIILSAAKNLTAQSVGIGTTTPDSSAILDLSSTNRGMLIPRMTTTQRDAIVSPAQGLMILNLDDKCIDVYADTIWIKNCGLNISVDTLGTWIKKIDLLGIARYGAVGFSIGSKGYTGTGWDAGNNKKDFWEYDPAANSWVQKADFGGTARQFAVGFSIGNKGYIGTGDDGSRRKDFWEYDPAANSWAQKTDFSGTERHTAVGFSIGNKGYIGTGSAGNSNYKKDFWEYDPGANSWVQKADFDGTARQFAVGFSIGNKGYIGTGLNGINYKKDFWEYDPAVNSWVQKTDFGGTERYAAVGFSIGSKGYIGTGYDGSRRKDFWEYDPAANSWAQKTDFGGTERLTAVGFSIGSKGYISTGVDVSAYKNDFWEYNPTAINIVNNNIGNTYIYQYTDAVWSKEGDNVFNTGLSTRLGIGTTSPANKLSVTGSMDVTGNVGIGTTSPVNKLSVTGSMDVTGNVGIGTTTPERKLDVRGDISQGSWLDSIPNRRIGVMNASLQVAGMEIENTTLGGNYSQKLHLLTHHYAGTFGRRFTIDEDGNVGIGTTSPLSKLHIVGNMRLEDGSEGADKVLTSDTNGVATWAALPESDPQVSSSAGNKVPKWNGTSLVDGVITDNGINVGIGIAPLNKLDVSGTGGLRVSSTVAGSGQTDWIAGNFGGADGDRVVMGKLFGRATIGAHNNDLTQWDTLAINPFGGNVGIGTLTALQSLDINGSTGHAITTTISSISLNGTHYTVIINGTPNAVTITLPAANTCTRRVYVIINRDNNTHNVSLAYLPITGGAAITTITNGTSITLQSDGTDWYQIR